jgi:uncharacterized protein YodC (DUF2158 family)
VTFKIGDIVRLKSGGPAMTVTASDDGRGDGRGDGPNVKTAWADSGGYHAFAIPCDALQLVVPQVEVPTTLGRDTDDAIAQLRRTGNPYVDGVAAVHPSTARGAEFKMPATGESPASLQSLIDGLSGRNQT